MPLLRFDVLDCDAYVGDRRSEPTALRVLEERDHVLYPVVPCAIFVALFHQVRVKLLEVLLADLVNVDFLTGVLKLFQ
jgi:hypothetical protein